MSDERLDPFKELNQTKVPWDQRAKIIRQQFPSVEKLNWNTLFSEDPSLMGRLINDILKIDVASPGKPGKRPAVDPAVADHRLRQILGEDFTTLVFKEALRSLQGSRSARGMAKKVGVDRNMMNRLLSGDVVPSAQMMEQVAKAFHKEPSFFVEYRMAYIFAVLHNKMDAVPEASVVFYKKMRGMINARGH